jgi:hypothetical protein
VDVVVPMIKNTQKFVINAGLFGAIGTLWAGTPSRISPFQYGTKTAPGNAEKQALATAGICDAKGEILAAAKPVLDVLGSATAFTRMYLSGNLSASECIVYFAPDGSTVSLMNTGGNMEISYPAAAAMFVEIAEQGIGSSVYRSVPFSASLTHDEIITLAAMIDFQRKQALKSIAGEVDPVIATCDIPAIRASTSGKGENMQWLCNVLLDILSNEGISSEDRLQSALESLAGKGYVQKNGTSYQLSGNSLAFARRMLIFDSVLTLTSGYLGTSGSVSVAGFTCIQAGIHDLLFIDSSIDSVLFQSVSSASVLENVQNYLTEVNLLEKLGVPAPGAPVSPARKFCPSCGSPIQPGKKFCPQCGAKID